MWVIHMSRPVVFDHDQSCYLRKDGSGGLSVSRMSVMTRVKTGKVSVSSVFVRVCTPTVAGRGTAKKSIAPSPWAVGIGAAVALTLAAGPGYADGAVLRDQPTVPGAPTGVVAYPTDPLGSVIRVQWNPAFDGGSAVQGYTVTASPGGQTCSDTGFFCYFSGLAKNRSYTFTVSARNAMGLSQPSEPSAPVRVWGTVEVTAMKPGNKRVKVSWSNADNPALLGFTVRSLKGSHRCVAGKGVDNCTVKGLKNGKRYRFQVLSRTINGQLVSSASAPVKPRRAG